MSKKSDLKSSYKKARQSYLAKLRYYEKQGYDVSSEALKPRIPKKITEGSIRRIQKLENKLKEFIHEQKVKTGFFTRLRRRIQAAAAIRKAAQPSKNPSKKKEYKKSPVTDKVTNIPKVKGKAIQPPNLSDAVLRTFESEIAIANNYIAKSNVYQQAVNDAANDIHDTINNAIDSILNKYMPDLTRHDVRVEIAQKLAENFEAYMSNLEQFLYAFVSDGQGSLNHTDQGIKQKQALLQAISDADISLEDKKRIAELQNELVDGEEFKGGEYYDY